MKHKHESFETCTICNAKLRECHNCGSDVAMVGGSITAPPEQKATCNRCLDKLKEQ
jgi:hypothetical protein